MPDAPLMLQVLYGALMVASMMLTWQVHRILEGRASERQAATPLARSRSNPR